MKSYSTKKLINEFPQKRMAFVQIDSRAVADLAHHVRTADNIDAVNDLALSQEGASGTHKTTCQIAREIGIL